MMNLTNTTENQNRNYQGLNSGEIVSLIFQFILVLWICPGNVLVITVYSKYTSLRSVTNYWILHLAIADFFMGLSMFIRFGATFQSTTISGWPMYIYCGFLTVTINLSISMTLCLLVAVTVDRYIAIFWPLKYPTWVTMKKAHIGCAVIWSVNFILLLTAAIEWRVQTKEGSWYCDAIPWAVKHFYIPGSVTSMLTLVILYTHIFITVYKQAKKVHPQVETKQADNNLKKNLIIVKTAFLMVGIFLIFWIPCIVVHGLMTYGGYTNLETAWEYTGFLVYANSGINPILYTWRLKEFRKAFLKILHIRRQDQMMQ